MINIVIAILTMTITSITVIIALVFVVIFFTLVVIATMTILTILMITLQMIFCIATIVIVMPKIRRPSGVEAFRLHILRSKDPRISKIRWGFLGSRLVPEQPEINPKSTPNHGIILFYGTLCM